jgi:ankyrin repeat protein
MERWGREADDDEMFRKSFEYFDKDRNNKISFQEFENRIDELKKHPDLVSCLDKMWKHVNSGNLSSPTEIELNEFIKSCLTIPRVKGHRTEWVRSLHLDEALAKRLHAGVLWDGLKGLKEMTLDQIKAACEDFAADVFDQVKTEWSSLQSDAAGRNCGEDLDEWDARAVMSKFRKDTGAFSGNFADPNFFHEGLESMLGLADPCILRAILREHVIAAESEDGFMPSNYFIYTSPSVEYARLFSKEEFIDGVPSFLLNKACEQDPAYPTQGELKEVKELFKKIQEIQEIIKTNRSDIYPGDVGSKILEFQLNFSAVLDTAAHFPDVVQDVKEVVSKFARDHKIFKDGETDLHGLECTCSQKSGVEDCNLQFRLILQFGPSKGRDSSQPDSCEIMMIDEEAKKFRESVLNELLKELRKLQHISEIPEDEMGRGQEKIYQYCKFREEKAMMDFIERAKIENLNLGDMGFTDLYLSSKVSDQKQLTSVLGMRCAEAVQSLGLEGVTEHGIIHLFKEESAFLAERNIFRRQGRRSLTLAELMGTAQILQQAQEEVVSLRFEEVIQQNQYTGPLFQKWNSVLRRLGRTFIGNKYATSIHTLVSAVLKTAKVTKLPDSRKVFRGLGGMVLDDKWFEPDFRGAKGGVEVGFLSTTLDRNVALEYSGVTKNRGVILEIDVGAIDCGARLDAVSQYPGEGELLFGPLSNLEALDTRLEMYEEPTGGETKRVITVSLKINTNLKALTIEEMISKRKKMMINILQNLREEIIFDLTILDLPWVTNKSTFEILPSNWLDQGFISSHCDQGSASGHDKQFLQLLTANKDKVKKKIERIIAVCEKSPVFFNTDDNFVSVFQSALELKHTIITHAVEYSLPANVESDLGEAMLHMAVRGRQDLIDILLNSGSKLNYTDQQGRSILHLLCENGHEDVLEFILSTRKSIRRLASLFAFVFVLYLGVSIGYIVFGFLFQRDPVPSWLTGGLNNSCLLTCDPEFKQKQNVQGQGLVSCGIITLFLTFSFASIFFWGHKLNRGSIIHKIYLLQRTMYEAAMLKLNVTDCEKRTPIHYAAIHGSVEMVHNLIESGASVNVLDKHGKSPLQYAFLVREEAKRVDLINLLKDSVCHDEFSVRADVQYKV